MNLVILTPDLKPFTILDTFESLIWTDRYYGYGDFEIFTGITDSLVTALQEGNYIYSPDSDHVMLIENRRIVSNIENGNRLIITGRSLESILDRRIIWGQTLLSGNFQTEIQRLLTENIINPTDVDRKINNFTFEASTNTAITGLTIDAQLMCNDLYYVIKSLCESNGIGFKISLEEGVFVFRLYAGEDRSFDQLVNPYVIFSSKFENLTNVNYFESVVNLKNVTLVGGEGEGADKILVVVGGEVGLTRRELFTDASDISTIVDGGTLTSEEYFTQLSQRGIEALSEYVFIKAFEGQAETTQLFKYGEHFFMGDIVQLRSEYGIESKSRVTELIRSQNLSGIDVYPTFTSVE